MIRRAGLLHRDISTNTVIGKDPMGRQSKGFAIDLNLASESIDNLEFLPDVLHRMGTMGFMAIEVLDGDEVHA